MANFLTKLFSAGASNLVDAVGDAIDKNVTSDEERKSLDNELAKASQQHEREMAALGLDETKARLADTDSARDNQSLVQESENASWLAKNVHSFLGLAIVSLTFFMYFWIIDKDTGEIADLQKSGMKDIIIYILGALTTITTQVVAYYFGSSQGSAAKNQTMKDVAMMSNKITGK